MHAKGEQLVKAALTVSPTSYYEVPVDVGVEITGIWLANHGATQASVKLYHPKESATLNNSTLLWVGRIPAGETVILLGEMDSGHVMLREGDNFGADSDVATVTMTVYAVS